MTGKRRKTPENTTILQENTEETNKMTCENSEDSDQPGHPHSLIRVFTVRGSLATHRAPSEDSDQTGWMPRLI